MYKCEREDEIIALLSANEYVTVEYLSRKMNISPSSIRRDLKNLEERGLVSRSYGGVKMTQPSGKHIPFSLRSHENSLQKKQIAKAALSLINPGDVVFLDASSSAYFLSELLPSVPGVTVITNGLESMVQLSHASVKAYCASGTLADENRGALVGGYAQSFFRSLHANVAIFSIQGMTDDGSLYDCYAEEVAVRQVMLQNADRSILLCDSSKCGKSSTFLQGSIKDVDYIISDLDLNSFFKDPTPEKYILV